MKKLKSPKEIEKQQRQVKYIVGIFFIFLMVFSTAGFALNGLGSSSSSNGENSGGGLEEFNGQYWVHRNSGQEFYFTNLIDLAQKTPVDFNKLLQDYGGEILFIDSGGDSQVINEIGINLERYVERIQRGCYGSCEENLPEKTCEENLIVFRESNERKVYQEDNCIFIEGDLVSVDAFLYRLLGFF